MSDAGNLAKKIGVDDLSKVGTQQANKILDKVKTGDISKEDYTELLKVVPEFAKLSVKYLDAMIGAAKASGVSQKTALDGVSKGMDALRVLAEGAQSDETREKIGNMFVDMARIISGMNTGNNQFWAGMAIVGVAAVALVGVATGRFSIGDAANMVGNEVT